MLAGALRGKRETLSGYQESHAGHFVAIARPAIHHMRGLGARRLARRRGGFVEAAGGVYQEKRGRHADLVGG